MITIKRKFCTIVSNPTVYPPGNPAGLLTDVKSPVIIFIELMLSNLRWPKVITLSGFYLYWLF